MKKRLSIPVDSERLKKLRRIAKHKNKTLTQSLEEGIDKWDGHLARPIYFCKRSSVHPNLRSTFTRLFVELVRCLE